MAELTLSMIVKNEEQYLEGCLESVKNIVDEIVIVDTGSTDNTLEIAKKYNSKIYHFDWVNDFSAARNFALSKSTGEWILYLDADERLSENSLEELRNIISINKKIGVNCIVNNIDEYSGNSKKMQYIRLFKNEPEIYFTGKAHEQILESLIKNNYEIINSKIEIIHLGYNLPKEELKVKASRNIELLLDEYKNSGSSYYAYQIGNTYSVMEDFEKAYEYYHAALKDQELEPEYKAISLLNMADFQMRNGNLESAQELVLNGLKYESENVWLHLLASQIFIAMNNPELALHHCKTAVDISLNQNNYNQKLLEVNIPINKVLYQAMLISLKVQNGKYFEHFLLEFEKHSSNEETSIIKKLILKNDISDKEKILLSEIINNDNLELFLTLISKLDFRSRIDILFNLFDKFKEETKFLVLTGISLMEAKNYEEAEEIFTYSLSLKEKDPSVIFYLISIYLETNQVEKIKEILAFAEESFGANRLVIMKLKDIKSKLQPILDQYQPS